MDTDMEMTKKTTILFAPDFYEQLAEIARKQKSSVGELVREACRIPIFSYHPRRTLSGFGATVFARFARGNTRPNGVGIRTRRRTASVILTDTNILMYAAGTEHPNKAPSIAFLGRIVSGEQNAAIGAEGKMANESMT